MPAPRPINILCFGDSLTSGYCSFGLNSHPYSIRLEDRLFDALPGVRIEVFTNGVPGDVVQNQPFKKRLDAELRKRPYDWVIMLGGTNDIGTARSAQDTFEALEECWDKVLSKGSKLLALTIPECAVQMPWLDESRKELNEMILSHQEPKFHTFDLKTHIPYHSLTEDEKADRWDDGLHLTPAGYDWMGSSIADAFMPLLERDQQLYQKAKPTSTHSEDTCVDERFSEEEDGSSKDIRAGYVMVRKKDLD